MHERTTRKSVTFLHPFSLAGVDEKLEAGTYIIETLEELIEGLSFVAFRRVSTTIVTAAKGYGQGARQVVTIDPRDLEAAQELDAEIEISTGPLAHLVARAMPSRRQSSAMVTSPRKPSRTMRIFSSAECCLRVARRMSLTSRSASQGCWISVSCPLLKG